MQKKVKEAIQSFNQAYLGKKASEKQRSVMEEGKLNYAGKDRKTAVKRLYAINHTLPHFSPNATKFLDTEMAHKIIPQNLSINSRIDYVMQGGKQLQDRMDVFALCQRMQKL